MLEMARAADVIVQGNFPASFSSRLAKYFKRSTMQMLRSPVLMVAVKSGANIPSMKVRLTFVKSRFGLGGNTLTVQDF